MSNHAEIYIFGILGNILASMAFLVPIRTFIRICKKKSSEGFHSIPYVMAQMVCMLWIYYAILKRNVFVIVINGFGCGLETIYILIFITFAPRKAKILTLRLIMALNLVGFVSILVLTLYFTRGTMRVRVVGWFCVVFGVTLFAAPLSTMRMVIRTKSVEFMPFTLSLFLTIGAIVWLIYGTLLKDMFIALPNVLGIVFGVIQMVLFLIYKDFKRVTEEPEQEQEPSTEMNKMGEEEEA